MQKVDGAYIYELGATLRPVLTIEEGGATRIKMYVALYGTKGLLEQFLYNSVFSTELRAVKQSAAKVLNVLAEYVPNDLSDNTSEWWQEEVPSWRVAALKASFKAFETILTAELQTLALYHVSPKGGFDTNCLTDNGALLFPSDLASKVPSALPDIVAATRCIAFELPTAAAFHMHRANEAVLRSYFDQIAGADVRPRSRNLGNYLAKLETLKVGDDRVIEVLKALKNLHRNPLMHPDDSIQSVEEAISLYAAIRAAIGYMLDRMSAPEVAVIASTTGIDID